MHNTETIDGAPVVSICLITYNHAPYIRECLDSMLMQQTSFPYEICIGEDESTDGTREICMEYAQKYPDRINLILRSQSEPARKEYASQGNYNYVETLKVCRGKYIADCDGDDAWIDPLKLQKQFDILESDPALCLVHSDSAVSDACSGTILSSHLHRDRKEIHEENSDHAQFMYDVLTSRYKITACSAFTRTATVRSVLEESPELFKEFANGDTPLWSELSRRGSFAYIDEPLAVYRLLGESATHSSKPLNELKFYNRNEDLKLYLASKYGLPPEIIRQQKIRICNRLAMVSGDYSEITVLYREKRSSFPLPEKLLYWLGQVRVFRIVLCKVYECRYKKRLGQI